MQREDITSQVAGGPSDRRSALQRFAAIVMLAFGLILGSAAVAAAIAFGLGGRDWAARQLEEWSGDGPPVRSPPPPRIKRQPPASEDDSQPPLV